MFDSLFQEEKIVKYFDMLLVKNCDDFLEIKRRMQAVSEDEQIKALKRAFDKQIMVWVFFAGALGYRANLELFKDPMKPNVLDTDPEIYLREPILRRLPAFRDAQEIIEHLRVLLPKDHYSAILEYYIYLETVVPKIAHLKGFIFADQMLPHTEPGYVSDSLYTNEYRKKVTEWSGVNLL